MFLFRSFCLVFVILFVYLIGENHAQVPGSFNETEIIDNNVNSTEEHEGHFSSFLVSISMIVVSEIGDKTFFIAAILAMTHSRVVVFLGAISALFFMTVLSAVLGHVVPNLIPRFVTRLLGGILFLVFGVKMLHEARGMSESAAQEEMELVRAEIEEMESPKGYDEEAQALESPMHMKNILSNIFHPIFLESFVMTFLAEWGDRSQISTIVLAASGSIFGVILGCTIGHALCTGIAVLGGRLLASKISAKTVAICGGISLIFFSILTFVQLSLNKK